MRYLFLTLTYLAFCKHASSQQVQYNYDRHSIGFYTEVSYHQPRQGSSEFIDDRGFVSFSDFTLFYQFKKKLLTSAGLSRLTRISEFTTPGRFQVRDQFAALRLLVGKRIYVVDHKMFFDFNLGTDIRKVYKRSYIPATDASLLNNLPRDRSFFNSVSGGFAGDLKLHFEMRGSESSFFVGLSSASDIYLFGSKDFTQYSKKFQSLGITIGFTSF